MEVLEAAKALLTLIMLGHASLLDLRTREIPPRLWLAYLAPLLATCVIEHLTGGAARTVLLLQLLGAAIITAITMPAYFFGMLGGADVFALLLVAASHQRIPFRGDPLLPPVLVLALYALAIALAFPISFFLYNVVMGNHRLLRGVGKAKALTLMFAGIPLKASLLAERRFWYPLQRPWENDLRVSFKVEEDDAELRARVKELIAQGRLDGSSPLWSTYGIPTIPLILVGYVLLLAFGEGPIVSIISSLVSP